MTIREWINYAEKKLRNAGIISPRFEAELLIMYQLGFTRDQIFLNYDQPISDEEISLLEQCLRRREQREPIAYIFQETEFYGISLYVNRSVLIPRPETELLVERAIEELKKFSLSTPVIIDVGTGSGAIAIALGLHFSLPCTIIATDISLDALFVAKRNIAKYNLDSIIYCVCSDVLGGLEVQADAIVSNPPYVAESDWANLMPEIRYYEPHNALIAGDDGLLVIRRLIQESAPRLKPGGFLLIEIAPPQREMITELVKRVPEFCSVEFFEDFSGHTRFVMLKKKGGK